jgi:hypothetical protein
MMQRNDAEGGANGLTAKPSRKLTPQATSWQPFHTGTRTHAYLHTITRTNTNMNLKTHPE